MPKRSEEEAVAQEHRFPIKRACDGCKSRKVRCDKQVPCSTCKASKVQCQFTPQSPQPRKKRFHLTADYEVKLNQIHARLEDIDHILSSNRASGIESSPDFGKVNQSNQRSSLLNNSTSHTPLPAPSIEQPLFAETYTKDAGESDTFEGETSMTAQSSYAHDMVQKAIENVPMSTNNPTMASALASLRGLTKIDIKSRVSSQPVSSNEPITDFRKLPLPPVEAVLHVLRWARETSTFFFTSLINFVTLEELTELCKDIFFCIDSYPVSTAVIVHGHLHDLFYELSWSSTNTQDEARLLEYARLSKNNLDISLAHLTILMPDSSNNISALLYGVFEAVQSIRPNMAWKLNSAAITMCLSLGWHRATSYAGDTVVQTNSKLLKFWNLYVMDKSLSIRLGRASILQDYDIDVELPNFGTTNSNLYMNKVFELWTQAGMIQGQVYERLYSPKALKNGPCPGDLLEKIQMQQKKLNEIEACETNLPPMTANSYNVQRGLKMIKHSDIVATSMITAMIHRALGNHSECLAAARKSLDLHQSVAKEYRDTEPGRFYWTVYLHWTILHVPCISFIIVFFNVLAVLDLDDLTRLDNFTQTISDEGTEAVGRLHVLCRNFWQVASLYVEARQEETSMPDLPGFPMSVSELNTAISSNLDLNIMMNSDLGDWFTGHQSLMGLLDDNFAA